MIEVIVYCAVVSIILISFYSSVFVLTTEKTEIMALVQSEAEGGYILERLNAFVEKNEIENAKKYLASLGFEGTTETYLGTKQFKTTFRIYNNEFKFLKNLP